MDLTKIKNDIPKAVHEWAEQHAENTCFSFVSVLLYRYGEIVERSFATRRYAKKGVLITEVQRRATGNNNTIIKNLLYAGYTGYIPIFEKEDKYSYSHGYHFKVFDKECFDLWYTADSPCGFHRVCLNRDILATIDEFKYCGYSGGDVIKYLNEYRKNPLLEIFGKLELPIAPTLIKRAQTDKQFRTYLYKNASDVRIYGTQATVYAYKQGTTIPKAYAKLQGKRRALKEIPIMKGHDLDCLRIVEYCTENKVGYRNYNDYLEAIIGLGLDLKDTKNIYPKNFKAMHDLRITEYESSQAKLDGANCKALYEQFAKAGKKATTYEYAKNGYSMVAPRDISDLKIEGKILDHCVGQMGYDKKMADGKVVIMFLRKTKDIKSPFVTIEYDLKQNKLLQAYAEHNTNPPDDATAFINKWLTFMKKIRTKKVRKEIA